MSIVTILVCPLGRLAALQFVNLLVLVNSIQWTQRVVVSIEFSVSIGHSGRSMDNGRLMNTMDTMCPSDTRDIMEAIAHPIGC